MKKTIKSVFILLTIFLLAGCAGQLGANKQLEKNPPNTEVPPKSVGQTGSTCLTEDNCCSRDEDCRYFGYTGACNTPEYVAKKQKEAADKGMLIGEVPGQENVVCICENQKCITSS